MIREKTAKSLDSLVRIVRDVRTEWATEDDKYFDPWFRGQRDFGWELQPNIFRYSLIDEEHELRAEFKRRGPQFMVEGIPSDDWGWYFLMQHYGAPTRLLDWTDAALTALFFAINSNHPSEEDPSSDAAVWMLDPWWLNRELLGVDSILLPSWDRAQQYLPSIYSSSGGIPPLPVAIDPPFIARRIAVQHGHFTIFGTDPHGLSVCAQRPDSRLIKIRLPKRHIPEIRLDLATLGVVDTSIYPDLKGLSDELIRYSKASWWAY